MMKMMPGASRALRGVQAPVACLALELRRPPAVASPPAAPPASSRTWSSSPSAGETTAKRREEGSPWAASPRGASAASSAAGALPRWLLRPRGLSPSASVGVGRSMHSRAFTSNADACTRARDDLSNNTYSVSVMRIGCARMCTCTRYAYTLDMHHTAYT